MHIISQVPDVRLKCVLSLQGLYGDPLLFPKLDLFTSRFKVKACWNRNANDRMLHIISNISPAKMRMLLSMGEDTTHRLMQILKSLAQFSPGSYS